METRPTSSLGEILRDGTLCKRAPPGLRAQVLASLAAESPVRSLAHATAGPTAHAPADIPAGSTGHALADVPAGPTGHAPADRPVGLAGGARSTRWRRGWWHGAGGTFLGGAAGIALCLLILTLAPLVHSIMQPPSVAQGLAAEIVASHVRALLSSRPVDVLSSDQHTVKPWFNGRIDYAPPVVDLQAQGFPLQGGRLDYVDHRPVAVLVYRYLKHPIDLYVFPDRGRGVPAVDAPVATSAEDGYSLARWHRDGMTYWAISDASPVYLGRFVEAIRHAGGH